MMSVLLEWEILKLSRGEVVFPSGMKRGIDAGGFGLTGAFLVAVKMKLNVWKEMTVRW